MRQLFASRLIWICTVYKGVCIGLRGSKAENQEALMHRLSMTWDITVHIVCEVEGYTCKGNISDVSIFASLLLGKSSRGGNYFLKRDSPPRPHLWVTSAVWKSTPSNPNSGKISRHGLAYSCLQKLHSFAKSWQNPPCVSIPLESSFIWHSIRKAFLYYTSSIITKPSFGNMQTAHA